LWLLFDRSRAQQTGFNVPLMMEMSDAYLVQMPSRLAIQRQTQAVELLQQDAAAGVGRQ
jgi:hypothetical protein